MKVIAFVPLPPPYAGPEIATQSMLDVLSLPPGCELRVVRANVRTSNDKKGNFDWEGIWRASQSLFHLFLNCLFFRPQKVYLLVSPSKAGFLRDAAAIFISKLFFCKVVGHYHGSRFHSFYKTTPLWYRLLIRKALKRLDRMMVQAERLKEVFQGLIPESRLSVLYNGLSTDCLERGKIAVDMRRGKKPDSTTFLFLGHISFTKGFYTLMTVYKKLLQQKKNIRLWLAGDFILNPKAQLEFLEGEARQFYQRHHPDIHREILDFLRDNPPAGVNYFGMVEGEKKYRLLEQADVFVLPSYTEGFPNVVLEAMAFGLGLIVTPVGALPEILKEPDNALFVRQGSADSLLGRIGRFVEAPSLSIQMGIKNRELVERQYRMEFTGKRFKELIF